MGAVVTDEIGIGDLSVRGDIRTKNEANSVSGAKTNMDTIGSRPNSFASVVHHVELWGPARRESMVSLFPSLL